jgi:hypothetical protein
LSGQGGGERTEKATKRKKKKAREEGQLVKSREFGTAASVMALMGFLSIAWDRFTESASLMMAKDLSASHIADASAAVNQRDRCESAGRGHGRRDPDAVAGSDDRACSAGLLSTCFSRICSQYQGADAKVQQDQPHRRF